jgi:Tfp pilus assembly PilM family ATPase
MSFLPFKSHSSIGLDIGSRTVKAVQLSGREGQWRISAATTFPRALPDTPVTSNEVRRLIDVLYRHNFHGRDVVLSAPPLRVLDGTLELPKSGPDASALDQIARMEFARLQKCEPTAFELGYWPLPAGPRSHQANRVMAIGCLHRDIEPHIETFEAEGLRVIGMDAEGCALARACASRYAKENGLTGLLDFGWHCCRLAVVYREAIVFSRVLSDSGLSSLFKSLERHLDVDASIAEQVLRKFGLTSPASEAEDPIADARHAISAHFDAMVQELNVSFSYATQQYPDASLQQLLIVGGGAGITGVTAHLTQLIDTECITLGPRDLVNVAPALIEATASPTLTMALGLAQFRDE